MIVKAGATIELPQEWRKVDVSITEEDLREYLIEETGTMEHTNLTLTLAYKFQLALANKFVGASLVAYAPTEAREMVGKANEALKKCLAELGD